MKIGQLTPQATTIGLGDMLNPDSDPEKDLIGQAGAPLCLLGSYIIWEKIKKTLPTTEKEILDLCETNELDEMLLENMPNNVKTDYLQALSRLVISTVRGYTFKAVKEYIAVLPREKLESIDKIFQNELERKKKNLEDFTITLNEPTEAQVRSLMPRKGESVSETTKRTLDVMFDCFADHNVYEDDNEEKVPNDHVIANMKKMGMITLTAVGRWQESLPFGSMKGKSLGR